MGTTYLPGTYLLRVPPGGDEATKLLDIRREFTPLGLLFARRFLHFAPRSDYLLMFDMKILSQHCRTLPTTWAEKLKTVHDLPPPPTEVVVAELPSPQQEAVKKVTTKSRPGRRARQMLKALINDAREKEEKATIPDVAATPPPPPPVAVLGEDLLVRISSDEVRLRPFHIPLSDKNSLDIITVYHPPLNGGGSLQDKGLHAEKCRKWLNEVLHTMKMCGILTQDEDCKVQVFNTDISRLSHQNLTSSLCKFGAHVTQETRQGVHAVLRSSIWFHSLTSDNNTDANQYTVRCSLSKIL